jgi:hypothetical protein
LILTWFEEKENFEHCSNSTDEKRKNSQITVFRGWRTPSVPVEPTFRLHIRKTVDCSSRRSLLPPTLFPYLSEAHDQDQVDCRLPQGIVFLSVIQNKTIVHVDQTLSLHIRKGP